MVWGIVGFLLFFGILLAWGVGLQIHTALWARPGYQPPEPKGESNGPPDGEEHEE